MDFFFFSYAFKSHNWSSKQWHHRLQSVVWTCHHVVLSVGRIRQCVTSFGSHRRNTGSVVGVCKFPFLLTGTAVTCPVRKRFKRDHCCRGRAKPNCCIVGSSTRWALMMQVVGFWGSPHGKGQFWGLDAALSPNDFGRTC